MKRKASGTVHECDAPTCTTTRFAEKDGDPVEGLSGDVFEVDDVGGRGYDFWACSREHVVPAILAVLNADD